MGLQRAQDNHPSCQTRERTASQGENEVGRGREGVHREWRKEEFDEESDTRGEAGTWKGGGDDKALLPPLEPTVPPRSPRYA